MTQPHSSSPANAGWSASLVLCAWVLVVAVPLWALDTLFAGVLQRDRQIAIQEATRNLIDEMDDFRRDLGFKAYARRITDRLVADMQTDLERRRATGATSDPDAPGSTAWCRKWHDTLERELGQPLLAGYITDIDTGAEFNWATPEFRGLETPTVTLATLSVRHAELQRQRRAVPTLTPVATACPPFVEAPVTEYEVGQMAEILFGPTAGINRSKPQLDSIYAPAIRDMIYVWHGVVDGPTAGEAGRINCVAVFRDQDVSAQRMLEVACRLTARRGCQRLFLPEYSVNHPTLHEDAQGLLYLDSAPVDWLVSRPPAGLSPEWRKLRERTCTGHGPSIGIRIDNTYIVHTLATWLAPVRAGLGTVALGVLFVLLWSRRRGGRHRPRTVRGYIGLALAAAVAIPLGGAWLVATGFTQAEQRLEKVELREHLQEDLALFEQTVQSGAERWARQQWQMGRLFEQHLDNPPQIRRLAESTLASWPGLAPASMRMARGETVNEQVYLCKDDGTELLVSGGARNNENFMKVKGFFLAEFVQILAHHGVDISRGSLLWFERLGTVAHSLMDGFIPTTLGADAVAAGGRPIGAPLSFSFDVMTCSLLRTPPPKRRPRALLYVSSSGDPCFEMAIENLEPRLDSRFGRFSVRRGGAGVADELAPEVRQLIRGTTPALETAMRQTVQRAWTSRSDALIDHLDQATATMLGSRVFTKSGYIGVVAAHSPTPPPDYRTIIAILGIYIILLGITMTRVVTERLSAPMHEFLKATVETGRGNYAWELATSGAWEHAEIARCFNELAQGLRERERIARFVSADALATARATDDGPLRTGGERRVVAILFCGIHGFSQVMTRATPEETVGLLNDYFTLVEEAIGRHHGVVDKFVGDTVMAVFHARDDQVGATVRAAQAALAIHDLTAPFNAARRHRNQLPIVLGVGIATGTVISGRIGSERGRLDQTVIGNAVNLAARLQQQALAHAPDGVIVDPACIRDAHGELRVEFIARVPIKGRSRTFPLYRLVGCRTRA